MQLPLTTKLKIAGYVIKTIITKPTFNRYNPDNLETLYEENHPLLLEMLNKEQVFFAPKLASWVISLDREETFAMAKDDRFSVSFKDWRFAPKPKPDNLKTALDKLLDGLIMSMNTADHRRLRRLVQPAFLPRNIHKMQDVIDKVIAEAVEKTQAQSGTFNLIDITQDIPLNIIAGIVGVEPAYHKEFKGLGDSILATYNPAHPSDPALAEAGIKLTRALIEDRRQNPTDDFISVLVQTADEDGDKLSVDEVMAFVASILTAGPDTTQHYLNQTIRTLLLHPETYQTVRQQPALIPQAITECQRINYFAHSGGIRFAKEDIEIKGQLIRKGEMIKFNVNTANYDAKVFQDPLKLDIYRPNLKETWLFGAGSHFCVGASLASAIGLTFIREMLKHFPNMQLQGKCTYEQDFINRKINYFPVSI